MLTTFQIDKQLYQFVDHDFEISLLDPTLLTELNLFAFILSKKKDKRLTIRIDCTSQS